MQQMRKAIFLYGDDNEDDKFLLIRAAGKISSNIRIETAATSTEVIDYLKGTGEFGDRRRYPLPDLVLLDFKLPPGGGLEVVNWVREHPTLSRLVIVFFTGSVSQRDIDKAYETGANALIEKEISLDGLGECLQRLVQFWVECNRMPSLA